MLAMHQDRAQRSDLREVAVGKTDKDNIVWVDINRLEEPKHVLREVDESNPELTSILESMREYGFLIDWPLSVCPGARDKLILKNGMQRTWCAKKLGLTQVPVVVGPKISEDDILEESVRANALGVKTRPAEYGKALAKMREIHKGDTYEMTAQRAKKPVEWVKKMLGLAPLGGQAAELVDKRKISIEAGLGLVRLQRAGLDLKPYLERAQKEPAADFNADVDLILKRKKGKAGPAGKLRPIGDVKSEIARARKDKSTPAGYIEALTWALRLDPASIEEGKTR